MLTERREFELSEEGFIGLTFRKDSDNACFFSANSVQKPKYFGQSPEGREAETNYRLGTQLPYMFIMNRLAHYLKVLQREQIGSWKERVDLERELNNWIGQYVADMDDRRPRRALAPPAAQGADRRSSDVEGQPGWYRSTCKVRPHFKYMGASFTLSPRRQARQGIAPLAYLFAPLHSIKPRMPLTHDPPPRLSLEGGGRSVRVSA